MFDLEQSIAAWRQQMLAAGIKTPVPLEELELHLREDIQELVKSWRPESEAFELAVQKIGQAHAVEDEFKKIAPAKGFLEWRLTETCFTIATSVFPLWICATLLHFKTGSFVDLTPAQQISGLTAVALFTVFAWTGRLSYKMLPVISRKRTRGIITTCCIVPVMLWWMVFLCLIIPRHDFTMAQFGVTFLWGFITPAGLMIGLLWGIEAAFWKRTAPGVP